jgi:outer membrane immunogenic protein
MAKASYLAGVSLALLAGSALAADLPSRKAPPPAFVPPPPAFSWTGLYGGVNIGYGFGASSSLLGGELIAQQPSYGIGGGNYQGVPLPSGPFDVPGGAWNVPVNLNGVIGGGQVGYNYQFNPWLVIGVETDVQATDLRASQTAATGYASGLYPYQGVNGYMNANQYVDWFGTVRGRIGLTLPSMPNIMVYGTGGFAYGSVESAHRYTRYSGASLNGTPADSSWPNLASQSSGSTTNTNVGWTAGGGVEWTPMSFPSWSIKAEYLYTDLGPVNQTGTGFYSGATFADNNSNFPDLLGTAKAVNGTTLLATSNQASLRWHTARVGLNWHFNPFAAISPLLAPSSAVAGLPSTKGPAAPVVEPFHPFQVRLKLGGVIPTEGTAYITDAGTGNYTAGNGLIAAATGYNMPVTALQALGWSSGPGSQWVGANTRISSSVIPTLDVAYYLTRNWAIEAICCVTPHHVTGVGPIQGASVIKTWVFPPSLMLQYHFTNFGAFQPYLGVGVNYTSYWGTRPGNQTAAPPAINGNINNLLGNLGTGPMTIWGTATSASITPSWGIVGQAGADYMFNDRWGVNVDVKYIQMEPNAHVWLVGNTTPVNVGPVNVPVNLAVKVNPLVISGGLTYRFGADWGVPKILPF